MTWTVKVEDEVRLWPGARGGGGGGGSGGAGSMLGQT